MAFQTGTATSLANLLSTLDTFLVANGWTQDEVNIPTGRYAWSKNSMFISVRWDTAAADNLGIYAATGWLAATDPGNHPGDDGQGSISGVNGTIDNGRYVDLGNGAAMQYWFFENDANPSYVHIVVERSAGAYRHFGWGELNKIGDWAGGFYAYGHHIETGFAGDKFRPLEQRHSFLLDGLNSTLSFTPAHNASIKIDDANGDFGLAAAIEWGYINGDFSETQAPDDRAGNAKVIVHGGFRGGPWAENFGFIRGNALSGLVHMYPITVVLRNGSLIYVLGSMEQVRGISMRNFAPEQTFVLGGDTWYTFPSSTKDIDAEFGNMQGIAYQRVDA